LIEAIHAAGYRNYTGFRRCANVVYLGHYHPDFQTVIARLNTTLSPRVGARRSTVSSPP
jgi:hypothetical protein